MNVTSLELSRELYKLSRWVLTEKHWYQGKPIYNAPYGWDCPAYDLGFLLEKLPPQTSIKKEFDASPDLPEETPAHYRALYDTVDDRHFWLGADTPEDAACKLCCELIRQGIIKP